MAYGFLFVALIVARPSATRAHGETLLLGTASSGGTALAATFTPPLVAAVTASFSAGGLTLYAGQFPSVEWATVDTAPPPYPLPTGTQVRMQLVAIATGASVKIGATTIDAPGESAPLGGVTPGEHVHPEWQLTLANGVIASAVVQFVFTAPGYTTSPVFAVTVTNAAVATPTATPSATATDTPTVVATATPAATGTATPAASQTAPPTATPTPTSFACPPAPSQAPCHAAAHTSLVIAAGPGRRRLAATWGGGEALDAGAFGDPLAGTSYALCVYDHRAGRPTLVWSAIVPPGGQCGARPCWSRARSGALRYRDRTYGANGVAAILLRPGANGAARVSAIPDVVPALPLAQDPAVVARLLSSDGACWQAEFAAPATRNDEVRLGPLSRPSRGAGRPRQSAAFRFARAAGKRRSRWAASPGGGDASTRMTRRPAARRGTCIG